MPSEIIIRHCAPTLAGLKVGNLFSFRFKSKKQLINDIKNRNKSLNFKGIFLKILKLEDNFALIYVYRLNKLQEVLKNQDIIDFLTEYGYTSFSIEDCFDSLIKNLSNTKFPHEIGVFLDYPLSDIKSFIEDNGANAKYVGCWKAYTNEDQARQIFEKYKKCVNIYCKKFAEGTDIIRLTVAC